MSIVDGKYICGNNGNTYYLIKYIGEEHSVVLPETINGNSYRIWNYSFSGCTSLTSVTIPNSVTSIGNYAFSGCASLTTITIGNSVASIGLYVFSGCTSLTSIVVSNGNPNYSSIEGVLFDKDKITLIKYPIGKTWTSYTVPSGVRFIDVSAFSECITLSSITISDSVISIRSFAFGGCSSLSSITLGNSVKTISNYTFNECTSLTTVVNRSLLPITLGSTDYGGVASNATSVEGEVLTTTQSDFTITYNNLSMICMIGNYTGNAQQLDTNGMLIGLEIYDIVRIQGGCFNGNNTLVSIRIYGTVTDIADDAFYGCKSLSSIDVEGNNNYYCSIDGVLFTKDRKTLVAYPAGKEGMYYTIPGGVEVIGDHAFSCNKNLIQLTIPESVTFISRYAFEYTAHLSEIVNLSDVVFAEIDFVRFSGCYNVVLDSEDSAIKTTDDGFIYISATNNDKNVGRYYTNCPLIIAYTGSYEVITLPLSLDGSFDYIWYDRSLLEYNPYKVFDKQFYEFDGSTSVLGTYTIGQTYVESEGRMIRVGTISFNTDGGSTISMIYGTPGTVVSAPQNPIKEGYDFVGWFTNEQFYGNEYTFTTIPESDVRLYARYVPSMHVIRVNVNDGNMGRVDISELNGIPYDSVVTVDDGSITVDGKTIRLIPADMTVDSVYSIQSISIPNGYVIKGDTEITITFVRSVRQYSVQFIALGEVFHSENVDYGSPVNYTGVGNNPMIAHVQYYFQNWRDYQAGTIVTGNLTYYAYYLGDITSWDTVDNCAHIEAKINSLSINRDLLLSLLSSNLNSVKIDLPDATIVIPLANATVIMPDTIADSYTISMSGILSDETKRMIIPDNITEQSILEYKRYFDRYPVAAIGTPIDSGINKNTCTLKWSLLPFIRGLEFKIYCLSLDNDSWSCHEVTYVSDDNGVTFELSDMVMYAAFVYGGISDDSFEIKGKVGEKVVEIDVTDMIIDDAVKTVSLGVESGWNIVLPASSIVGKEGTIRASVETVSSNTVTDGGAVIPRLQNSTVYSINLSVGDESITTFSSAIKLSLPYKLADGEDPKNLIVLYVADGQIKEEIPCDYSDGFVSFETTHLSLYAVAYEEPNSGLEFPIMYIGIGAVVVLAVLGAAIFIMRKRA
ncbi:MAG: leucine-rich repeat protein [Candidatus Methanomethylophilaceae archaeon]|nr:leucine-rich repeat protein [Candidatus Methanomethylophilaceae archaeon]